MGIPVNVDAVDGAVVSNMPDASTPTHRQQAGSPVPIPANRSSNPHLHPSNAAQIPSPSSPTALLQPQHQKQEPTVTTAAAAAVVSLTPRKPGGKGLGWNSAEMMALARAVVSTKASSAASMSSMRFRENETSFPQR